MEEIDQSNATLFIHYDPDTKMIYLAGKVSFIHIIVDYILELQPIECAEKVVSNRRTDFLCTLWYFTIVNFL